MFKLTKNVILSMMIISTSMQIQAISQNGSLHLHVGSMCSGKTEVLIADASKYINANPELIGIFKPNLDTRVLANNEKDPSVFIASRNGSSIKCKAVANVAEMKKTILEKNYVVIAIDEAQFFNKEELITFVHEMLALHKKIIISGLDLDFRAETF